MCANRRNGNHICKRVTPIWQAVSPRPNTGASDLITSGRNGEVVPIRDPAAIAEAILKWADLIISKNEKPDVSFDTTMLSFNAFERNFMQQLRSCGLSN